MLHHPTENSTPRSLNERIRQRTEKLVEHTVACGPNAIARRLRSLDREWDTERVLETTAASFILAGTALAATRGRRWLIFPGVVAGFLLQHGLQGFCPPLPVIRALGVRTRGEIDSERFALMAARGDFGKAGAQPPREIAHTLLTG
jgi:hypothetical protein